jgi:hypothetical protein
MRTLILSSLMLAGLASVDAQWCVPPTAIPYGPGMPGIVQFTCVTVDRYSADIENYPNNSYVHTGLSVNLQRGATYPAEIGFTIDQFISPHMNLRVWIDLNQDGELEDVDETLLSVDHVAGPTYNGQITIPANANLGATRMRVTAKMCSHGGHTLPTPCDLPPDGLGYHGEIEDYDVMVVDALGIDEVDLVADLRVHAAGGTAAVQFTLLDPADVELEILDITGRTLHASATRSMAQGLQHVEVPFLAPRGVYLARIRVDGVPTTVRFVP